VCCHFGVALCVERFSAHFRLGQAVQEPGNKPFPALMGA
jgi:hypothetical protein